MLIGLCLLVSTLLSCGVCLGTEAFLTLHWLYLLPLCFVGAMLLCVACVVLLLYIMGKCVNMDELPEKESRFYRMVVLSVISAIKTVTRLRIRITGMENVPTDGKFLLVCNHTSDADPVILLHCFKKHSLAFISKRENEERFLIGPILRRLMSQPINRENDREALKTILRCIQLIQQDTASVAVFPEGYTSLDGKLRHFRSGVFKIAQRAKVPVVVCTLQGTQMFMKSIKHLAGATVDLHVLRVIAPEEFADMTTVALGEQVYTLMAENLGPENVYDYGTEA